MPGIDEVDEIILRELRKNGRITLTDLGKKVNLTPAAVKNRVEKLEKLGAIKGYSAVIDSAFLGEFLTALIEVELVNPEAQDLEERIRGLVKMENVLDVYKKTGEFHILIRATFKDVEALNSFLRELNLKHLKNLARRIRVSVVLESFKEAGVPVR
ncbi:Lrp/AsnC family transcriptional regulator [Pyrococcus yayanosii]|uniref:Transcriptional regulator, AsnC family n=1 Tax=Pyrococcus yayanosii (strain CH1 / JCM 16557) TaxID=529709 RepID=F8AGH6_PYRYC|nr:Lrp/AsnC family transcriptional regulator [Pyrococcus yayanosii]AEH25177.1 transcriptional regulator, AsnC family [Pyrococcus yayanosii CH1]